MSVSEGSSRSDIANGYENGGVHSPYTSVTEIKLGDPAQARLQRASWPIARARTPSVDTDAGQESASNSQQVLSCAAVMQNGIMSLHTRAGKLWCPERRAVLTYWQVIDLLHRIAEKARIANFNLVEFMTVRDVNGAGALWERVASSRM